MPAQAGTERPTEGYAEAAVAPFISHGMTEAEMSDYRQTFGVRDPAVDYNALFDGHGTGKAPPTEEEYENMVGGLNVLDSMEPTALPEAFDLSTSPSFPIVGNQRQQGSCTGWAVTYYAYGYIEAVDNGWTEAKEGNASQLLSPAWTYNKVNGGVDRGSWEWDNMMVLKDWGACTMALLPYTDADWTDWGSPAAFRQAPLHRIQEAFRVPFEGYNTVDTVKALVHQGIPVTFGLDANNYNMGFKDDNYIISSAEYHVRTPNHANTFVGFDDSVTDDGDVGAFRAVNSWGGTWGDEGYYWLTYEAFVEMADLLDLCFVQDIQDYSPSMRASWQFDPAPSRDATIEFYIGPYDAWVLCKSPYYWLSDELTLHFPTYMCLDITEFMDIYEDGTEEFYLYLSEAGVSGTIDGLKVELFQSAYDPSSPTQVSGEAWNDPQTVPGHVDLSFAYYPQISLGEALDSASSLVTEGDVRWVGVNHEWSAYGDAVQSGYIGDLEESRLSAEFFGPVTIGFEWKVSSEESGDFLSVEVEGIELAAISGDVGWEARSYDLGPGIHTVSWIYSKDDLGSDLDDCGWIDNLTLTYSPGLEPPVAHFEFLPPEGDITTMFEFSATGSYDPDDPEAVLLARWDWNGDGTWDTEWSTGLVAYHVFEVPGEHTVRLMVKDSDGLMDVCERRVIVFELIPEFGEFAMSTAAFMVALAALIHSRRRRVGPDGS